MLWFIGCVKKDMAEALAGQVDSPPNTKETPLEDYQEEYVKDGSLVEELGLQSYAKFADQSSFSPVEVLCFKSKLLLKTDIKKLGTVEILFEDFLGIQIVDKPPAAFPESCPVVVHTFALRKSGYFSSSQRKHEMIVLLFKDGSNSEENLAAAKKWKCEVLRLCKKCCMDTFVYDNPHKRRDCGEQEAAQNPHYLILINPAGGKGLAVSQFQKVVQPMLDIAEITYETIVTERQGHAHDLIQTFDLSTIDGLLLSSGDGLLYEVVNGLMKRKDWREAISVPIAMIPTGSGNALFSSVLHESKEEFSLENAAFHIIRGGIGPMDLVLADTAGGRAYFNIVVGWGLVADVDIESEKWRRLGDVRFQIGGLVSIAKKKMYQARLWYIPAEDDSDINNLPENGAVTEESKTVEKEHNHPDTSDDITEGEQNENSPNQTGEIAEETPKISGDHSEGTKECGSDPLSGPVPHYLASPSSPLSSPWKLVEGNFVLMSILTMTHLGYKMYGAPDAMIGGGIFYLTYFTNEISRKQLLDIMLDFENGLSINNQNTFRVKAKAFRLEPITPGGRLTLDGEMIDYGTLQCEILQGLCRVMTRKRRI